jgi:hypothetical protein
MGFALGLHGLEPGFAWFQTQDKPAKNRVYFLTTPYAPLTPLSGSNLPLGADFSSCASNGGILFVQAQLLVFFSRAV